MSNGFVTVRGTVNNGFLTVRGENEKWLSNCKRGE